MTYSELLHSAQSQGSGPGCGGRRAQSAEGCSEQQRRMSIAHGVHRNETRERRPVEVHMEKKDIDSGGASPVAHSISAMREALTSCMLPIRTCEFELRF